MTDADLLLAFQWGVFVFCVLALLYIATDWYARLLCALGVHGPEWFGYGLGVSSPRNRSCGPGIRRCVHCGARWQAYEGISRSAHRVVEWARVDQ